MSAGEHPLLERSTVALVSDAADAASEPCVRPAIFLRPRAGDGGAPPPAPPGDPGPVPARPRGIEAEFGGWAGVPRRWPEWVAKLRRRHELLWREAGILGGILASTCRVHRRTHERVLLQLAAFWSGATGTFVFPWGEATLTLADVAALASLPLLGAPVRAPVSDSLEKDVAAIEAVRAVLNRSKKKKASYGAWVKRFVERAPEEATPSAAGGGGGDGEARELIEHGAFLSMWLSLFVLPGPPFDVVRREVLPLAARLARGESVALAPAALATIYHDLSALKRRMTSGKENEPFLVSAPMHILQLWVWEHFTQLRPERVGSSVPGDRDMPRAARWHEARKKLSSKDVHSALLSPKEFQWRPYEFGSWVGGQDTATSEALLSYERCLHPCELVGMNCIQQYSPHRVARQLGFDQDIPGTVPRASSGWEKAWETYNIEAKSSAFIFPNHKPSVTVQYATWWKPYSTAYDCAIANAAKMKEGHDSVSLAKRKMESVLAGNSGKKPCLRVPPATHGCPPNIPADSSHSHPAIRRAAAAPGNVLRACPPHLRFRAMSATGMPQPPPHAACDPLDHISLSERLNRITKMLKQPNTRCMVKGSEQETIVERVRIVIPKPPVVGPKKAVLHKVIEQALPEAVASSEGIVHESSCGFGTERPQARCLPVATATRGCPPNIPAGINAYPFQSSGSHGAIRQTAADAADDAQDDIFLSERLNSITQMLKQPNTECLAKYGEKERTVESVKIVIPKSPSVGPKKAVLHKVIEQALPDAVGNSCGFGTERPQVKCLQQNKDQDLSSVIGENNSRQGHCDAVLLNVVQGAVSIVRSEATGAGTEVDMLPTHEDLLVISNDDRCDKTNSKAHEVHLKSHMSGAKMSLSREQNEDTKQVDARNNEVHSQVLKNSDIVEVSDDELDEETSKEAGVVDARNNVVHNQVLKKVIKQGNFGDIIEISDDELDEETGKEAEVFVEATRKEDALCTMHMKSPRTEPAQTILQECNEEKQMVRETNEKQDNLVMKEGTVQKSYDRQLASVLGDTTLRQQPDVLTHAATVQTYDGLLKGPTEEMDTCVVTGDIGNVDKVPKENGCSFSGKGNEDILVSNQESEHPMEQSAGTSINKSGNSERFSSRLLDGSTKLVSQEVCTKTLYYLSRFDRMKDAWDKDGDTLPKMIEKASAIRQAEMAELRIKIKTLKEEIRALEAA